MFYKVELKDHIRLPPSLFADDIQAALTKRIKTKYDGYILKDLGFVIDVSGIKDVKEGVIIPGDGAPYYETTFELITLKPELHEVVLGRIKDVADFGAFISIGPNEGMIHISQTMDDFVSYSKDKSLLGKDSKRNLKAGDLCRARIIAASFKDMENPKLGLTMRQPALGRLDWIEEDLSGAKTEKKAKKSDKKEK